MPDQCRWTIALGQALVGALTLTLSLRARERAAQTANPPRISHIRETFGRSQARSFAALQGLGLTPPHLERRSLSLQGFCYSQRGLAWQTEIG